MTSHRRLSPKLRSARGRSIVLAAAVLIGAAVATVALSTGGTRQVRIVRVVVQHQPAPPPAPQTTTTPALPAASAGTNGSFTPPAPTGGLLRAGSKSSFARLAAGMPGPIGLALVPLGTGDPVVLGSDEAAHGWSTTKVPVLVALLHASPGGLTGTEQALAEQAITASDNASILALFADLERLEGGLTAASAYIDQLFRQSGDDETTTATAPPPPGGVTTFGQTEWSPSNAVRFFRALSDGCLLGDPAQTNYVLGLMEHIIPSESWGLGSAGFGVPVAFKGGWGPEASGAYLVRQAGVIDPGSDRGAAVAIVAHPPPGGDSFSAGVQMVSQTAQWLSAHLVLRADPAGTCAG